jgi:succinyl-diaminopimelate desuccinylase
LDLSKSSLLERIEKDRSKLIDFLSGFIRAKSPNPPGDTREAASYVTQFLDSESLPYRRVAPRAEMPNIVGSFECGSPGRHLVLNGHMDVFPIDENDIWAQPPWSGAVVGGKVWGRGATDMKSGLTSLIFTFAYLHGIRDRLRGRLTLTCVSDEETFGPCGTRYLMEHVAEARGDACLSGEPSGLHVIRFGEKGPLWLRFTVRTRGAHGAYTHASESAIKIAARLVRDLESVGDIEPDPPDNVRAVLDRSAKAVDDAMGPGAHVVLQRVTLNVGMVRGGLKVNMIPSECAVETDFRLPIGVTHVLQRAELV